MVRNNNIRILLALVHAECFDLVCPRRAALHTGPQVAQHRAECVAHVLVLLVASRTSRYTLVALLQIALLNTLLARARLLKETAGGDAEPAAVVIAFSGAVAQAGGVVNERAAGCIGQALTRTIVKGKRAALLNTLAAEFDEARALVGANILCVLNNPIQRTSRNTLLRYCVS